MSELTTYRKGKLYVVKLLSWSDIHTHTHIFYVAQSWTGRNNIVT